MSVCRCLIAITLCLAASLAHAAGFGLIELPAGADGPALKGATWYPCAELPGEIRLGMFTIPGTKDCPVSAAKLPLIVVSHGRGGTFVGHHDTAETLADAGFVVAAISHAGDTRADMSRSGDLSVLVQRPTDIKRLIDFMLAASPVAAAIDPERIGFFGFSRGGYTGLVLIGADPDWSAGAARCEGAKLHICDQLRNKEYPATPLTNDPRIKAAVIADPLAVFFTPESSRAVKVPVQLWASAGGGDGVSPQQVAMVAKNLPGKVDYRVVPNSGHFAFLTPCPAQIASDHPELCADAAGFDRVAFHKQLDADVLAFFRAELRDR